MECSINQGYKDMFERNRSTRKGQIGSDFSTWKGRIEYDLTLLKMLRDNELITKEVFEDNSLLLDIELHMVERLMEATSNFFKKED
tara:strand:+ start:1146 stop:1403 length:258 start_codon:yes stop_codon:yes gene_type:complete